MHYRLECVPPMDRGNRHRGWKPQNLPAIFRSMDQDHRRLSARRVHCFRYHRIQHRRSNFLRRICPIEGRGATRHSAEGLYVQRSGESCLTIVGCNRDTKARYDLLICGVVSVTSVSSSFDHAEVCPHANCRRCKRHYDQYKAT